MVLALRPFRVINSGAFSKQGDSSAVLLLFQVFRAWGSQIRVSEADSAICPAIATEEHHGALTHNPEQHLRKLCWNPYITL